MLVVIAIIMLMMTLVVISVAAMLRSNKLASAASIMVNAADEARTASNTFRRNIALDLTRLDETAGFGRLNRLTTIGSAPMIDTFEIRNLGAVPGPALPNWTGACSVVMDETRCLLVSGSTRSTQMMETIQGSDYELVLQARVKFKPGPRPGGGWSVKMLGRIDASGDYYALEMGMTFAANTPANTNNFVKLYRSGAEVASRFYAGTIIKEGLWYRLKLLVKGYREGGVPSGAPTHVVAGKFWVDSMLEPAKWSVGPYTDTSLQIQNGPGGFEVGGNSKALVDDVFFDNRSIRKLPDGIRIIPYEPSAADPTKWIPINPATKVTQYNFPLIFRADGTAAASYVICLEDMGSGDRRWVKVEPDSGRTYLVDSLFEAIKQ
jgi:hypothetical protein